MNGYIHAETPRLVRGLTEIDPSPRLWLVDELLELGGSLLIAGEEGCGKSAIVVALAAAIVTGRPFFGAVVMTPGPVLYVAAERTMETVRRLRVVLAENHQSLLAIVGSVDLQCEPSIPMQIARQARDYFGRPPALVIVDTIAAVSGAADENSTRDVKRLCDTFDILRSNGAALVAVHHAKRGENRSRGSQVLPAWADGVLMVERVKAGRRFHLIKSNVVEIGRSPVSFGIEGRPLDQSDPAAGTVAIAVEIAGSERKVRQGAAKPLSPDQRTALAALQSLTPDGAPIPLEVWRSGCISAWNKRSDGAAREAWRAVKDPETSRLLRDGLIVLEDGMVRPSGCQVASEMRQEIDASRPSARQE